MEKFDVAIIGAGPAGLFAVHQILKCSPSATVLLVDTGKWSQDRACCGNCNICNDKDDCDILCGFGGGGLFSDGKLVLDLHSGGKLDAITALGEQQLEELTREIVDTLKKHDGLSEPSPPITGEMQEKWEHICNDAKLKIKHYDVLHMGTENLHHISMNFVNAICSSSQVTCVQNCQITQVITASNGSSILHSRAGDMFAADSVIFSVGKTGSDWLRCLFDRENISFNKEVTYLGVRIEVPQSALDELFEYSFDPKIWAFYDGRKVKTHCFCRHGNIISTNYMGFKIVGGHTQFTAKNGISSDKLSHKANFNVLASTDRSIQEIRTVLKAFTQLNPAGPVVQDLFSFLTNNSTFGQNDLICDAKNQVGNIREILDTLDSTGTIIADFILRIGHIAPRVLSRESLIYAPALEWYMDSVNVDSNMETSHRGWFAVGDGAGLSQGIVHSAATGIIAAKEICRRMTLK